jgi:hypothetical protein
MLMEANVNSLAYWQEDICDFLAEQGLVYLVRS